PCAELRDASIDEGDVMIARKAASFYFLTFLVAMLMTIGGCGSESNSNGTQPQPQPQPNIAISPVSAMAGSSDLVLTVTGSNFLSATHNKSVVVWSANGSDTFLATTFVSSTQLTAVIPAALLANP